MWLFVGLSISCLMILSPFWSGLRSDLSFTDTAVRTCAFEILHSTRINVLYQQILFSLQSFVFIRYFESVLIEVFFTGNIYPATCIDIEMWDCVHWNRPPPFIISIGMIYRNNKCFVDGCILAQLLLFVNTIFNFSANYFYFNCQNLYFCVYIL